MEKNEEEGKKNNAATGIQAARFFGMEWGDVRPLLLYETELYNHRDAAGVVQDRDAGVWCRRCDCCWNAGRLLSALEHMLPAATMWKEKGEGVVTREKRCAKDTYAHRCGEI